MEFTVQRGKREQSDFYIRIKNINNMIKIENNKFFTPLHI